MFARAIRPSVLFASAAATVSAIGYGAATAESRRVWNSQANWDTDKKQYNEDLKTNRHKIAAQHGATPDTIIHNQSTSDNSMHIDNKKPEGPKAAKAKATSSSSGSDATDSAAAHLVQDKLAEAEADTTQTAYNEETGEINWDCPCLGGMAHGPCGEDFKAAFSCFVHSTEEPKGVDCIDKFRQMQACFKEHPDVYGEEIADDDESIQPPSPDGGSPLSTTEVTIEPTHSLSRSTPKAPNAEPPQNNPAVGTTHENTPAKGVVKIQPKAQRGDKNFDKNAPAGNGTVTPLRTFKLAQFTTTPYLSEREGSSPRFRIAVTLRSGAGKIDTKGYKQEIIHVQVYGTDMDSDDRGGDAIANEMQMMDQTPTPTGTNDLFSFSPEMPSSQPLSIAAAGGADGGAMDDFDASIDGAAGNPDPFWTEDLFTPETQVIEEGQADLGKMGKEQDAAGQPNIYQWREGRDTTPTADIRDKPLPLQSDSPVVGTLDDLAPKQHPQQLLHNLIPALGVSTPKAIPGNAFHHHAQYPHLATSPPDQLRKQASLAAAAAAPVPGSPSGATGLLNAGQGKHAAGGTPSALGRYYLSASDPQHISKHPQGSISFPDPTMAQYHHPVLPQLSPLLKNRGGNAESSPTLSVASDETFMPAGTSPQISGSMMPQQSLFPPMSKVIPPVATYPALQQVPQQPQRKAQGQQSANAFAYKYTPRSGAGGGADAQSGTSPLAQIHQSFAGIPSGPLGSGQAPPRIKPDGTPMLGSPSGEPGADTIPGSFNRLTGVGGIVGSQQQQRPLLRQSTADSFVSTSSEEEDLSSPMILPDTSLRASDRSAQQQQAGLDSPRFGNGTPATPRAGPAHASPRMGGVGSTGTTAVGGPLFPPLSSVTKVRPNAGTQHAGQMHAATSSSSKFTFQNPSSAPVFPPMSPTSSSSGESGDEGRTAKRGDRGSGWRFRSKSPFISAPNSQATAASEEGEQQQDTTDSDTRNGDQGTSGSQETQGNQTDDEWARYRAGSITIGGIGYGNGGREDESDEEDDRKRRRPEKVDKKLETNVLPTPPGGRSLGETERKNGNSKPGEESEEEDEDDDDEEDDDGSLESEDGYQDATSAAGPFPGGKAVRPPAKRKFPKSSDDRPNSAGEAATTVTRTKKDGTVVRKKRKSAPAEDGDVFCDYVEPLPVSLQYLPANRIVLIHPYCLSHLKNAPLISTERTILHVIGKQSTLEMKVELWKRENSTRILQNYG
ncbi:hypothetical protein QFC21_000466 [Naganishia friedmannii]|uniref:Uncharacterized protein n=1 Tax=Naganishia friedmannii TaxID=89922 RepID=A0ACC2WCC6_9TREE|nr:hypothetical protein QFC21_000466 [Naganishia friedmannii]